jgi:YD repeat-containing protein
LAYDGVGQLQSITDVANLSSTFAYDGNHWITNLVTPYGTTSFIPTGPNTNIIVLEMQRMSEPYALIYRGLRLRVEVDNQAAAAFLDDQGLLVPVIPPRCNTVTADFTTRDGLLGFVVVQRDFQQRETDHGAEVNGLTVVVCETHAPEAQTVLHAFCEEMLGIDKAAFN